MAHFVNRRQGARRELSMDEPGFRDTLLLLLAFGAVAHAQMQSSQRWRDTCGVGPESAMGLLSASTKLSVASSVCWLLYYWGCGAGNGGYSWLFLGRGLGVAGRSVMSLLLLLMAQGECVSKEG